MEPIFAELQIDALRQHSHRGRDQPLPALDAVARHARQGQRAALAGVRPRHRTVLRMGAAHAHGGVVSGRQQPQGVAHVDAAGMHGTRHHGAHAVQREGAVDGQPEGQGLVATRAASLRGVDQQGLQLGDALRDVMDPRLRGMKR